MAEGPYGGQVCPAIVGPTASGKTGLVTALAKIIPIEVISLDSRQIYHGLRIGTAQPTAEELTVCPHHLIDFVSPDEKYDAARFRKDFEKIFVQVKERSAVPILVGGAGMYLTALKQGFMSIPNHSEEKLAEVRKEIAGWENSKLREELFKCDPDSFARIHANDIYRSQRAMEIFLISGQTMTALIEAQQPDPCLSLVFPAFVLQRPVPELDSRIAQRTKLMLQDGWIEETEQILEKCNRTGPGLMSIGYREIVEYLLDGKKLEELEPSIIQVTRQYAKRQRTMFRNFPDAVFGHPDSEELVDQIVSVFD